MTAIASRAVSAWIIARLLGHDPILRVAFMIYGNIATGDVRCRTKIRIVLETLDTWKRRKLLLAVMSSSRL